MMKENLVISIFLFLFGAALGAADYEVEQVHSPKVEKHDVGQMMSAGDHKEFHETSPINRMFNDYQSGCLSCRYVPDDSSRSSYSSSSYYNSHSGSGSNRQPVYSHTFPIGSSSSRYESKNEQKFVNGQQVYGLNHETEYKDGRLIRDDRKEKLPSDFGVHGSSSIDSYQQGYSSSIGAHSRLPERIPQGNSYKSSSHQEYSSENVMPHVFQTVNSKNFQSEVEKLKKQLRSQTYGHPVAIPASYGSSHRSEYESESKYVNGQKVYDRKEERKYKDGELVHDIKEENGPEDFGISNTNYLSGVQTVASTVPLTHQTGFSNEHSSHSDHRQFSRPITDSSSRIKTVERTHSQQTSSSNQHLPSQTHYGDNLDQSSGNHESYQGGVISSNTVEKTHSQHSSSSHQRLPSQTHYRDNLDQSNSNQELNKFGLSSSNTHFPRRDNTMYNHNKISSSNRYNFNERPNNAYIRQGVSSQEQGNIREASSSSYYDFRSDIKRPTIPFTTMGANKDNQIQYISSSSSPTAHSSSYSDEKRVHNRTTSLNIPSSPNVRHPTPIDYDYRLRYPSIPSNTGLHSNQIHKTTKQSEHSTRYDINPIYEDTQRNSINHNLSTSNSYSDIRQSNTGGLQGWKNYATSGDNGLTNQYYHSNRSASRTQSSVRPMSWVETATIWEYVNGRVSGETVFKKFYENDVLMHQNQSHRTRDQMSVDGVNVLNLDLTEEDLAKYGTTDKTTTHSQRHEMHQIKRYRNGIQEYELNHERFFRDGNLVDEKRNEKDEHEIQRENQIKGSNRIITVPRGQVQSNDGQHYTHLLSLKPTKITRKHEVKQEEKFVDGQKVYDLYHAKEYKDGRLIHENKTELGPNQLGVQQTGYHDYMKTIQNREQYSPEEALLHQELAAKNVLKTSCLTCSQGIHSVNRQVSGTNLNLKQYVNPRPETAHRTSTYEHSRNLNEQYTGSHPIREEERSSKKWATENQSEWKSSYQIPSQEHRRAYLSRAPETYASMQSAYGSKRTWTIKEAVAECAKSPCQNKGSCKARNIGPVCVCPFGVKGNKCQEVYCPTRYCLNNGVCSIENDRHVCTCPEGFSGARCGTQTARIRMGVSG